jgi:cardiolipin synthase C
MGRNDEVPCSSAPASPASSARAFGLCIAAVMLLAVLAGCASLPTAVERAPTQAFSDTGGTQLGRSVSAAGAAHPGRTAVHALPAGRDAFAARHALAGAAQRSIDVQYYIWHPDTSGGLLAHALWQAAERGVRVRMLLDDQNTKGMDPAIATLGAHPNIEVRLFNPFANRSWRLGDYVGDFARVNRRMHNKSFTVDNQVSVVGGRNVGDEYLGAETAVAFADLDVIVAGPVVRDISASFDRYWNSPSAYPAASLLPPAAGDVRARVLDQWERLQDDPRAVRYAQAVRSQQLVAQMLAGTIPFEWVPARVVADDPAKVLNPPKRTEYEMAPRLQEALGRPERELLLVSPYFVPGPEGTAALVALVARGVKVSILTNSLAATDVSPVYAGYSKYRSELLRGGVGLFELKPGAQPPTGERDRSGVGGSSGGGSSGASLHAKTFAVDRQRVFVGSFNLDPRSARLNTELGVVLESPALATRLAQAFDEAVPRDAYEIRLAADGRSVEWIERTGSGQVIHTSTPGSGPLRQLGIGLLSILPIEWLL